MRWIVVMSSRSREAAGPRLVAMAAAASSTPPIRTRATPSWIAFFESKKRYTFAGLMRSSLAISATVVFWYPIWRNKRSATTRIRSRVSGSTCSEIKVMALNVQLFRGLGKRKCGFCFALMLRRKIDILARAAFFQAVAEPEGIEARQIQQGQEGCNKQAAHDGDRHRAPERGARQRDHRQDRGQRRQHHRAGAPHGGFDDGFLARAALGPRAFV